MKSIHKTLALTLLAIVSINGAPGAQAAPKVCKLDIAGNDMMQFDKKELSVAPDCVQVELTLKHTGKLPAQTMGHNWVLVKTADVAAVSSTAMMAGLKNHYVPPGDKRVLAATQLVGGGESTSVKFSTSALKKGEAYTFMCTFPGHNSIMKGILKFG